MQTLVFTVLTAVCIEGCATSTGIVPVGPDTYVLSEMRAPVRGGGLRRNGSCWPRQPASVSAKAATSLCWTSTQMGIPEHTIGQLPSMPRSNAVLGAAARPPQNSLPSRLDRDAGLGRVIPGRRIAPRRRARVIYPVQELGAVVPHAVDGAGHRPEVQHVVSGRPHQCDGVFLAMGQPIEPICLLKDHRHPLVQLAHGGVGAGGQDSERAHHLAGRVAPPFPDARQRKGRSVPAGAMA